MTSSPPVLTKARVRLAMRIGTVAIALIAVLYLWHRVERFLIQDTRFTLSGPDGVDDASVIQVQGAPHA